jgi:hypothetical protein
MQVNHTRGAVAPEMTMHRVELRGTLSNADTRVRG